VVTADRCTYSESVREKSIAARKAIIELMHEVFETGVVQETDFKVNCSDLLMTLKMYRDGFLIPEQKPRKKVKFENGSPVLKDGKLVFED
jgi:hypothetical protein